MTRPVRAFVVLAVAGASLATAPEPPPRAAGTVRGEARTAAAHRYLDGPPPGHTGGFGEPACQRCHFDAPVDSGPGGLSVRGLPATYRPGASYEIRVALASPGLGRAGFELALRCAGEGSRGRQAGALRAAGPRSEVVPGKGGPFTGDTAVSYARHTEAGSRPAGPDSAVWRLRWRAEVAPSCGPVLLHAAANAANGDASEFGDRIHTLEARTEPPARPGVSPPPEGRRSRDAARARPGLRPPPARPDTTGRRGS